MRITVYIEPNGDVIITTLIGDLVPVASALDHTERHMQRWSDTQSDAEEGRRPLSEQEAEQEGGASQKLLSCCQRREINQSSRRRKLLVGIHPVLRL